MLLTGTFPRTIDDKLRLAMPKRLRDVMLPEPTAPGDVAAQSEVTETQAHSTTQPPTQPHTQPTEQVLIIAPGTDGSLALYTEESFARLADQLAASPPTGQDVRAFSRLFFSQAERLELDSQGRIRIPPELATLAGLTKEVVLVGVRDHLELWDRQRWQEYLTKRQAQYDELAERAFGQRGESR